MCVARTRLGISNMAFNGTVHTRPLWRSFCCLVWASNCCLYRPKRVAWGGAWSKMCFLLMYFVWEECHAWCMWRVDEECLYFFFLLSPKQQDKWQRACFALLFCYTILISIISCVHASSWFYRLFFNLYSAAIGNHIVPGRTSWNGSEVAHLLTDVRFRCFL